MLIVDIEDSVFEYEGKDNIIMLPITGFVKKDGTLAVTSEVTKTFFQKYPSLPKKWGYMISNNVIYPSFLSSNTNLIAITEKLHYAASSDLNSIKSGYWYIKEMSLSKPDYVFYFFPMGGKEGEEEFKSIFSDSDNVVLLKPKKEITT